MSQVLFQPYKLGRIELKNRIVMAPMTRNRAIDNIPNDLMTTYYSQRAEAGLIITEGTSPSPNGLGYARIPGLFSKEQVQAWAKVTSSVHKAGSKIFVQLMHTGRVGAKINQPAGTEVLAPSAIRLSGEIYTDKAGMQPYDVPVAMTEAKIESTIEEFVQSARLAIEAGFDGIELHGANGYLIEQFISPSANQRQDKWGGSIDNRLRFALEVARRTAAAIGADRVGIRISPYGVFNDMGVYPDVDASYTELAKKLSELGLAYIHIVDHSSMGAPEVSPALKATIRKNFKGTLILSGGYDAARAEHDLTESKGDLVAFGRPFISNPRLPSKLKSGAPLAAPDFNALYTPGPQRLS